MFCKKFPQSHLNGSGINRSPGLVPIDVKKNKKNIYTTISIKKHIAYCGLFAFILMSILVTIKSKLLDTIVDQLLLNTTTKLHLLRQLTMIEDTFIKLVEALTQEAPDKNRISKTLHFSHNCTSNSLALF